MKPAPLRIHAVYMLKGIDETFAKYVEVRCSRFSRCRVTCERHQLCTGECFVRLPAVGLQQLQQQQGVGVVLIEG